MRCGPPRRARPLAALLLCAASPPSAASSAAAAIDPSTPRCDPAVVQAVRRGDAPEIQKYAVAGVEFDCYDFYTDEYLLVAALSLPDPAVATVLAGTFGASSPQLQARNGSGATPLLMAADRGFTDVVVALVQMETTTSAVDEGSNTVLHIAATWPDTVAAAIEHIPEPAPLLVAVNAEGDQPLHRALKRQSYAAAEAIVNKALLRVGPNFTAALVVAPDAGGDLPVHLNFDAGLFRLLVRRGASLDARNRAGALPFHIVAGGDNNSAASGALEVVARDSMDVRDNNGSTPLHYAAGGGCIENSRWLIEREASGWARDTSGVLPLTYGLRAGYWDLVPVFSSEGMALQSVIESGRPDLVELLVAEGTPADAVDPATGRSSIYLAAEMGFEGTVGFLLAQGVRADHLDRTGLTVLAAAARAQQDGVVRFLVGRGARVMQRLQSNSTALHIAADAGAAPSLEFLLENGADVNVRDSEGRTPIHVCSTSAAAEVLLRHGAAAEQTLDSGLVPLHSAVIAGRTEVVLTLLAWRHSDINVLTFSDNTPLHFAALVDSEDIVKILVRWCADVGLYNNETLRPADYARNLRMTSVIHDATLAADRCTCDCGAYVLGPQFTSSGWGSSCTADVRCQFNRLSHLAERVRCAPVALPPQSGESIASAWQPSRPNPRCKASVLSGASFVGKYSPSALLLLAASSALVNSQRHRPL